MDEINEDSCVLTDRQISLINDVLNGALVNRVLNEHKRVAKEALDEVFQKITKLNDLAKTVNKSQELSERLKKMAKYWKERKEEC